MRNELSGGIGHEVYKNEGVLVDTGVDVLRVAAPNIPAPRPAPGVKEAVAAVVNLSQEEATSWPYGQGV